MRFLIYCAVAAILCANSPAFGLEIPEPSSADTRVRTVTYDEMEVFRIVGSTRISVQIVLRQGEEIDGVAIGDTVAWENEVRGNNLFLKAREPHPPTNMQVVTIKEDGSTRSYNFELITREGDVMANQENVYFSIRFQYPREEAAERRAQREEEQRRKEEEQRRKEEQAAERALDQAVRGEPINWRYTFAGDANLKPRSVFDNGTNTVIQMTNGTRMPSVYLGSDGGEERLANTTIEGDKIVVHDVTERIILRQGGSVAGLFNEGIGNEGHYSETGTISHHVDREVIGGS